MNWVIRSGPAALALFATVLAAPVWADSQPKTPPPPPPSYADLADLADGAPLVIRAQPRKIVAVEPVRAPGVRAGWGRFYIEAKTEALIAGTAPLGGALAYLVDLPLDAKGKPPEIKRRRCMCCGGAFDSEGIHHRMCGSCRTQSQPVPV